MDKKIKPNDPGINHRTVVGKAKSTPEDSKLDPSGNEHGQNDIFNNGGGQIGHETPGPEFDPGSSSQQQQRQTEVDQEQSDGQSSQHHHHRHHHRHETKIRGKVADRIQIPWILSMVGSKSFAAAWEAFIGICFFGYFFLVTYESVFSYENRFVWALLFTMDTLFLVDLLIRLFIEIWRSCTATPCIFFLMPLTLKWYIFQMISLFPLEIFCLYILDKDSISSLNYIDYFRINRFFNIFRLWRYYQILDEERMLPEMVVFLLKFFTVYLAFLQLVACVFYLLARTDPIDYMFSRNQETLIGTWLEYAKKVKPGFVPSPITHYILTLSFATNIVTTVGYGDIVPRNEAEMLVSIVIMLIGAIGMVGIFGSNVTSFQLEKDGARYDLFYRVQSISKSLKRLGSSALFTSKVREYYDCLWNFREGVFHVQFIHYLPTSMHEDILFDICTEMFLKAILFRGLEESFLRAVCRVVEVVLYNPDMIICQQGGYAMTMYYIIQGECVVKSRHNSNINTAILRAGCVFGESSLFFSFPYSVNVETRTFCQLLRLNKEKMMEVFNDHIHILNLMRSRIQERMSELRLFYEEIGQPPITWVQFRQQIELLSLKPYADYPTDLRWSHGCNRLVVDDIVDDTEAAIIVDMPCLYKKYAKKNMTVYSTCVVPPTLISPHAWVHYWHIFMMTLVMVISFLAPFSLAFTKTSEVAFYTSTTLEQGQLLVAVVCIIDVVIEVTTACPVTGIHYKFKDGIRVKMNQLGFYVDILAAIPFEFFQNIEKDSKWVKWAATFTEIFKLWKVHRYLRYLDDAYPQRLFWFRLIKTTLTLLYVIHFLACFMFILACPFEDKITEHGIDNRRTCLRPSWLDSWFLDQLILDKKIDETVSANRLANKFPYLISVYFSTATITSAGFGDFSPQILWEMMALILAQLFAFFIIGYFTALLTSALSCTTRPKVFFQQKLLSIRQFLDLHGLSGGLRDRIIQHYQLQHQFYEGVVLPEKTYHLMYDSPSYLEEDYLFTEVEIHLEGISIFSKVDPKLTIKMAKLMERYVLPPNIYFLRRGDVRRQMYIIFRGSVAILKEESSQVKHILEATGHFGIRDLLFGVPSHNNIKTLSYCVIYSIDLQSYNEVFERETDLLEEVEKQKESIKDSLSVLTRVYAELGKLHGAKERKPKPVPSWIIFPTEENPYLDFCDFDEFLEPYEGTWGSCLRFFLMRRTIHPAGTFALCWNLICALFSSLIIIDLFMESQDELTTLRSRIIMYCAHSIFFVDLYLKLHWGYYTDSNHLISHPIKTATHSILEGPLIYTFCCGIAPYEVSLLILRAVNLMFVQEGVAWVAKLRWINLMHVIRLPIILQFGHDVFKSRTFFLLTLYVLMTLAMCTCISSYALYTACPWGPNVWKVGQEKLLPACFNNTWIAKKTDLGTLSEYWIRWVAGVYYVAQTTLVVGYGDMIVLRENDLYLLILMLIFGFLVLRCIISDMTAAAVDTDEIRTSFREEIIGLRVVMQREFVQDRLIKNALEHMKHTWTLSRGFQPRLLLDDLHPALQSDLFCEYIGDALSKVPLLFGVEENVMRTVYQYLRKLYFTRGERIMRRGNLEYEMFIIVDGDIWISGRNMELKCVLGPGESMGETQMLFGLQRKYSAVAANNVEVFALTAEDFSQILERYPGLKDRMETKLYNGQDDLFERKIHFIEKRREVLKPEDEEIISARILKSSAILRDIVYAREVPGFREEDDDPIIETTNPFVAWFHRNVLYWGPEDFDLPFFYFATAHLSVDRSKKCNFLFHPKSGFNKIFQALVLTVCLLSTALGAYQVFFALDPDDENNKDRWEETTAVELNVMMHDLLHWFMWAMEGIMILHIVLQFLTPFPTVEGKYCKSHRYIAFRYVANLSRFWLDLIATIPVHCYEPVNRYTHWRWLNLLRALRLLHYYRTQYSNKDSITVTTFRFKLLISVPSFGLMAHLLACVFYSISSCDLNKAQQPLTACARGWTNMYIRNVLQGDQTKHSDLVKFKWYIRSLYWVVTTISSTGFGDIVAETVEELALSIVCVFCGAFILSIILSHFTAGITSRTKVYREYMYQVKLLAKYLSNIGLTKEREDQVMNWFLVLWDSCRGKSYSKTTAALPLCLQIDVNLAIYYNCIRNVPLFENLDKRFLRQLANRLHHTIYLPGLNVVNEGDKGSILYIVSWGKIAGYTINRHGQPKLIRWYDRGSCFGRLTALFYDQTYTKTYRAESETEILYIHQKDLFHLAKHYPPFAANLQQCIMERYRPELGTGTIFSVRDNNRRGVMNVGKLTKKHDEKETNAKFGDAGRPDKTAQKNKKKNQLTPRRVPGKQSWRKQKKTNAAKLAQDLLQAHVNLRLGEDDDEDGRRSDEQEIIPKVKKKNEKDQPKKKKVRRVKGLPLGPQGQFSLRNLDVQSSSRLHELRPLIGQNVQSTRSLDV